MVNQKQTDSKKTTKTKITKKEATASRFSASKWATKSNAIFIIAGLVFGLLMGIVMTSPGITGATVGTNDLGGKLNMLFPQIEVLDIEDEGSIYRVTYSVQNQPGTFYVTKDGTLMLVGQAIDLEVMEAEQTETANAQAAASDIPKTDKPEVEVFVMSYCPYGLQMEKAVLPVQELLGDEADISIKFVHYLMHGEKEATENTRQYCIQKEEPEKFYDYLECFVRDGQGSEEACMDTIGIDKNKIEFCSLATSSKFNVDEELASGAQYPAYNVDKEASEGYGVQGSPAVVINGQLVTAGRTPEALKQAVCNAFTTTPEACETELSSASFNPGFGLEEGTGADSSATCG